MSSNRYTLASKLDTLRAGLARAERDPQLIATGIQSNDLYALAETRIDALIAELDRRVSIA